MSLVDVLRDRVTDLESRKTELEAAAADPERAGKPDYPNILRELGSLAKVLGPWHEYVDLDRQIQEAREKVAEAGRQLQEGRIGSAIFFASRAQRVSQDLIEEADAVSKAHNVRFVRGRRVNLREGPSTNDPVMTVLLRGEPVFSERDADAWTLIRTPTGRVGWIHSSLLLRAPVPANAR